MLESFACGLFVAPPIIIGAAFHFPILEIVISVLSTFVFSLTLPDALYKFSIILILNLIASNRIRLHARILYYFLLATRLHRDMTRIFNLKIFTLFWIGNSYWLQKISIFRKLKTRSPFDRRISWWFSRVKYSLCKEHAFKI